MVKDRTYNKEYIRKVFTNKLIQFIEENGEGLYDKDVWDFFPKQYDEEYIMIHDNKYYEMVNIFIDVISLFSSCTSIIFNPIIDVEKRFIDFDNWTILIDKEYKQELNDIKRMLKDSEMMEIIKEVNEEIRKSEPMIYLE